MSNKFKSKNPIGIAFGGFWGVLGGSFAGIIIGFATGWVSGVVVGVNTYGTALVGAAGGAIIGAISGLFLGVLAGNIASDEENKLYGQKLAKLTLIGLPASIVFLFYAVIFTLPLHNSLLSGYIVPFIQPPLNVPTERDFQPAITYESLPIWDRRISGDSFYIAESSTSFAEINTFKNIYAFGQTKEIPLLLIDDTIFIAGFFETDEYDWPDNFSIFSVDVTTGKVNWQSVVGGPSLATDGKRIFAEFPNKYFHTGVTAFEKGGGKVVWQTPLPPGVAIGISYLTVTNDTLSVKTYHRHQGAFYSLDPVSGEIRFAKAKKESDAEIFIFMVENGVVYEWFGDSIVASGENEWRTDLAPEQDFFDRELAAPVVTDGLFLLRRDYPTYSPITAIDKQNGAVVWKVDNTAVSNLAVAESRVYFVTMDAVLMVVDLQTGKPVSSLNFNPSFGAGFDFLNNAVFVAADDDLVAVYFEDKRQLSVFRFE